MRYRIVLLALLVVLGACSSSTAPDVGRPDQLELGLELGRGTVALTDTVSIRLVARNPLTIPIEYRLRCGDRGLAFELYDRWGSPSGPGLPLCIPEGTGEALQRIGPGDSLVMNLRWAPRTYISGRLITAVEPGGYAVVGVLEAERRVWTRSTPAGIVVRAPTESP